MLETKLPLKKARPPAHILCLGAHCDDIDIGCGGALLAILAKNSAVRVTWVVFSSTPKRERELRASAKRFLARAAGYDVRVSTFRDGFFPAHFSDIKETFETLKELPEPDLIFTHHRLDHHQDHRIVAELTWNTFRNHIVLEYEVPKYEGGLTTPSAYIALQPDQVDRKVRILLESYKSQARKRWFTPDTFRGLMRLRGIESGAGSGWAEGFHATKLLLG
jgi:LmbE family N-acetylglucosaminyl deacetylase